MDLLLWRHAEAADGSPDATRPLTTKGLKQAQRIAHWLDEHAPGDLRILVSPALRTQQTVLAWTKRFEITEEVGTDCDAPQLLAATGWPSAGGRARGEPIERPCSATSDPAAGPAAGFCYGSKHSGRSAHLRLQ